MIKKILIGVGILIIFALGIFVWSWYTIKPDADKYLTFIKEHPEKAALYIVRNDTVIASQNADTIMPLASTVKTLIAIEFAKQATAGIIKLETEIDTAELDKYYLKGTDGNAHSNWLNQLHSDNLLNNGKVKLREVVKGMIRFSSNANTEYLMDLLGIENINALRDSLGLTGHHAIYPFVSSLMICAKQNNDDIKQFTEKLDLMPMDEYIKKSFEVHQKMKTNSSYKKTFDAGSLLIDQQHIWSNRLPGGSVKQYVSIMQKINSHTYFDSTTQIILDDIFEWPMINKKNRDTYKHFGGKGGSTTFVLTEAIYATDNQNNQTSIAIFFNNLFTMENIKLQAGSDEFISKILTDEIFRKKLQETFKN